MFPFTFSTSWSKPRMNYINSKDKGYIHSLRFFYKFVLCDDPKQCAPFASKCNSLIVDLESWLSIYRKKIKEARWKKDLIQLTQLFKGWEIRNLDKSEYVHYCKDTIQKIYCRNNGPSFKEFTSVRGYILKYLCLDSASRTGALANVTCKEFFNAQCEDDSFKVADLDHKTLAKAGPCVITFDLYQETQIFLNHFQNSLDGIDHEKEKSKFFVS